ncbi:MAG: tRNA pseudouridine(55) synthase TruB [Candidatus Pacebacteria bacterium]|nr:tRNA pseudouridine(55) synthase TruB [Candidatus Paceibacterota bacterium]
MDSVPELLLIDKPKGITSFDVIRRLRRQIGIKKIGHAGTLDPLATGLMILGVGPGTKRLTGLIKLDKEYIAEVLIGERRTTGDMEGDVMEEKAVTETVEILQNKISIALEDLIGDITLPVSAYSAIKVDGVPMYKRARKAEKEGEIVTEVPVRTMKLYEAELFKVEITPDRAVATVRFFVGSGTYIRSLAEELGKIVGYPATLRNLRRIKVGEFGIEMAQQIEDVEIK